MSPIFLRAALVTGSRSAALTLVALPSDVACPFKIGCSSRSAGLVDLADDFEGIVPHDNNVPPLSYAA